MEKYKVYFENYTNERRVIAEVSTAQELFKAIYDFLDARNYTSYYTQIHETPDKEWCIDVGSWFEFFYVSSQLKLN